MTIINNVEFIPKINKDIFERNERDNTKVVKGRGDLTYLSEFTTQVYDLCKKNTTIKDIILILSRRNSSLDSKTLIGRIVVALCFLENCGIIQNERGWIGMIDGKYVVGEAEYKELSHFLIQFLGKYSSDEKKNNSIIFSLNKYDYSVHSLRTKSFNSIENYFVLVKEHEIKSLFIIGGLHKKDGTVNLNGVIFYNENRLYNKELFEYLVENMKELGVSKIKFSTCSITIEQEDVLCELGFVYETKLVKENNGRDVLIFSYIIED